MIQSAQMLSSPAIWSYGGSQVCREKWSEILCVSMEVGWFSCQYCHLAGSETWIRNHLHPQVLQLPMQKICHWFGSMNKRRVRENSCITSEAKVLILYSGAISCDIPLYQSGLKIACEIIFQHSSCSNFIKVLCSINSLLKHKYFLVFKIRKQKEF